MSCFCVMGKLLSKSKAADGLRYSDVNTWSQAKESSSDSFAYHPQAHNESVTCLATVEPGKCLSGGSDKTVVLYNFESGTVLRRWIGHERDITKVLHGSKCQAAFSASRDKTVRMWLRESPNSVQVFSGHDLAVTGLTINDDNTLLCSGSRDNSIRVWDIERAACLLQHHISRNLVTCVKWAKEADFIVQTSEDKEVRIWNSKNLQNIFTFPKKQYIQTCCDISEDNNYCLTCSNGFSGSGCEATLWDLRQRQILHEYRGHLQSVCACIFIPNNKKLLATASNDSSIKIWDQETAVCLFSLPLDGAGPITSLITYNNGMTCASTFSMGIQLLRLNGASLGDPYLQRIASF